MSYTEEELKECRKKLALVIMIKNEERGIVNTFNSVKDYCSNFVVLDTGSTDNTVTICKEYCTTNNVKLHLKETTFVDFEYSRNELLDFADSVLPKNTFCLLLDCNDELRQAQNLVKLISGFKGTQSGFHLKQQWWTGASMETYFNIRMVISHNGWRYKQVVHEYICKPKQKDAIDVTRREDIILFQDRTKDDDKSMKRFKRDKELLYTAHIKNPEEPRVLFYLAQTCSCLQQFHEAYKYYTLRTKYEGFLEEIYQSMYRLGEISQILKHPWEESETWYIKAYAQSNRAEPLYKLAEHYATHNWLGEKTDKNPQWNLAYTWISQCCKLMFPHHQLLFTEKRTYIYKRWSLYAKVAYNTMRFKEAKEAAIRALTVEDNQEDLTILVDSLKKEKEVNNAKLAGPVQYNWIQCVMPLTAGNDEIVPPEETKFLEDNTVNKRDDVLKRALNAILKKK